MAEELKACPLQFCGGPVQFHKDDDCAGCHLIECQSCKTTFDLAKKADPENQADNLEELQMGIAHLWNRRAMQGQGGEAVEVVAWQDAENPLYTTAERRVMHDWAGNGYPIVELMTVAQHQRILAAATRPADQVEDDLTMVKVSRELLEELRDAANEARNEAERPYRISFFSALVGKADALLNGGRS